MFGLFRLKRRKPAVTDLGSEDLEMAADIHAEGFSHAWDAETLAGLIRARGGAGLVAHAGGNRRRMLGFMIYRVAADEAEVITIVTARRHRRNGAARALMNEMIRRCLADRLQNIFLEVDESNARALGLYASLGFREAGKRKAYYRNASDDRSTGEGGNVPGDALIMRLDLKS